jgi:hypothetical protein
MIENDSNKRKKSLKKRVEVLQCSFKQWSTIWRRLIIQNHIYKLTKHNEEEKHKQIR